LAWDEKARRLGGQPFSHFLPAFHTVNVCADKEQCMDIVYVLLGVAFFLVALGLVKAFSHLQGGGL
jgi:hypothetical protein